MQAKVRKTYNGELKGATQWRGQVELSTDGGDWLFTIECSLIEGKEGDFIGFPSRKTPDGDYFNMVRGSDKFQKGLSDAIRAHLENPASDSAGDEYARAEEGFGA